MKYYEPHYDDLKPRMLRRSINNLQPLTSRLDSDDRLSIEQILAKPLVDVRHDTRLVRGVAAHFSEIPAHLQPDYLAIIRDHLESTGRFSQSIYRSLFFSLYELPANIAQLRLFLKEFASRLSSRFIREFVQKSGQLLLEAEAVARIREELLKELLSKYVAERPFDEAEYLAGRYRIYSFQKIHQLLIYEYLLHAVSLKPFFDRSDHFIKLARQIADKANEKRLVEAVILKISDERHKEERFQSWIEYIKQGYGTPFSPYHKDKWLGIGEEARRKFNRWVMLGKLEEFYLKMVPDDPTRRAEFWFSYVHHFLDIEYIPDANQAVLKLTDRFHLIVEFLQIGNACYIYRLNNEDDYARIVRHLKRPEMRPLPKISYLKQKNGELDYIDNLRHFPPTTWHFSFDHELRKLGYRRSS
ncbi:MAG: hypothetical protein JXL20_10145 [Deltaproteobacteria bacterium]|nr:hypothetical protein [Deltaproteobacteria bacterium]